MMFDLLSAGFPSPSEPASSAETEAEPLTDEELLRLDIVRAWEIGELSWVLRENQLDIYEDMLAQLWGEGGYEKPNGPQRRYILKCHRRFGKSFLVAVILCEFALRVPNARLYWAAETSKQVTRIILPNMRKLLETCPDHVRPVWNKSEGCWRFPTTGAELHIAGCEDEEKADRLRGDGADVFVIDEAGSIRPLKYVYQSIALWMAADRGGRIIMPSSPAKVAGHPFTEYSRLAETGEGGFAKRTIYDSNWSADLVDELARECGGKETSTWKREAEAEDAVDEEGQIIAEFNLEKHVRRSKVPDYAIAMVAIDPGTSHLCAVLWAYIDWARQKLVVQRSWAKRNASTPEVAKALKDGEELLWNHPNGISLKFWNGKEMVANPYRRVSDTDARLILDLVKVHKLRVSPTAKDDADAARQALRTAFYYDQIEIWPDSGPLADHLFHGRWNDKRTAWATHDVYGHFDCIAALIYLWRNVRPLLQKNPLPPFKPASVKPDDIYVSPEVESPERDVVRKLNAVMGGGRRRSGWRR